MTARLANGSKSHHANGCNTGGWTFQTVCFILAVMINVTKSHLTGFGLTGGSLIALAGTAIRWATTHVSAVGDTVCANGLPTSGVAAIASGLSVLGIIGVWVLALAPSVKDETNVKAGISSGKRLSTVPPAPTTTEIK